MIRKKLIWPALIVAAASAPSTAAAEVYFGGGPGAYGEVEITTADVRTSSDTGTSWAAAAT